MTIRFGKGLLLFLALVFLCLSAVLGAHDHIFLMVVASLFACGMTFLKGIAFGCDVTIKDLEAKENIEDQKE